MSLISQIGKFIDFLAELCWARAFLINLVYFKCKLFFNKFFLQIGTLLFFQLIST